jgi:uncharacterized protein (TIGR02391 family)
MKIVNFNENVLQKICDVLGATNDGLTGFEISTLLKQVGILDSELSTKRHRLFDALKKRQDNDKCGNLIVAFIQAAMNPVRYLNNKNLFENKRILLNEILSFSALSLGEDGCVVEMVAAKTINEAQHKANRLKFDLSQRGVHHDVLKFCRAELLQENYFHAVLEATKSLADKIRGKASLRSDGASLVDEAFGLGEKKLPLLAFNSLQTETHEMEHKGLMNLLKGIFGAFRNSTAHAPKITWNLSEHDALDLLTMASLLHRRLDSAIFTNRKDEN